MKPKDLLQEQNNNLKDICGIYLIYCIQNEKGYIGQSRNMPLRFNYHKYYLRNNKHVNTHLQNCWNKYGEINFVFMALEGSKRQSLNKREQYYIDLLDKSFLLNIEPVSNYAPVSEETKLKISNSLKGRECSASTRDKISKALKGKKKSMKAKVAMSEAAIKRPSNRKGIKLTEEHKKKISESRRKTS